MPSDLFHLSLIYIYIYIFIYICVCVYLGSISSLMQISLNIIDILSILLSVGCRFLICNASRIWSFCLLFWCSNIVVLSVRIFRSCVVGHECFFKCWAIELVSERCIVSLLDRVVEVKPTYILLLSEIQSPKGHLNLYITLVFCKTPIEGEELFLMTRFEVLSLL